jgi:hypothetical protein
MAFAFSRKMQNRAANAESSQGLIERIRRQIERIGSDARCAKGLGEHDTERQHAGNCSQ